MPQPVSLHERATRDLHAPWWSDVKDATGRYAERVTIYADYLQADAQAVQARLLSGIQMDPLALQRAAQTRNSADLGFSFDGAEKQDLYLFQALCVEMTNKDGARQPIEDDETFTGMLQRDAEYITSEIRKLTQPLVAPTEMDAEMASASNGKKSAQQTAEDNFRGRRQAAASRG
jgi:hypothetical protein